MLRYSSALLATAVAAGLLSALPAGARRSAVTGVTNVTVTAGKPSEFRFALSKKSVPHGTVIFTVINKGILVHDFRINGRKTKLLNPGSGTTLKVVFKQAGKYPFICTVTGHATAGMKGILKVT